MTPLSTVLAGRSELFDRLRRERDQAVDHLAARFPEDRRYLATAAEVRSVAVVLGSPRGGTSVFKQVLAAAPGALALPGEHRLFLTLLGLNHPDHGELDECRRYGPIDDAQRDFLLRNLLFECRGEEITEPTRQDWERYGWDWALRLRVQWPGLVDAPLDVLVGLVRDAVLPGVPAGVEPALPVLRALRRHGLPVDPYRYDLDRDAVREWFPDLPLPVGPPTAPIVEISPFLALRPCRRPTPDPATATLVLKASSDAYRIPLLHEVFTGWDVRELHLTRNPVASVNGLLDGWAHRGFWQHDLSVHGAAGGARPDWNFDLCDGWQQLSHQDLTSLAVRQWLDPHRRILDDAKAPVRLRFEDFQAGGDTRVELMARAADAAGLRFDDAARAGAARPRSVNSTAPPEQARWLRTRPELADLVRRPDVAAMCELLGYRPGEVRLWP